MFGRRFHEQFLENIKTAAAEVNCGGALIHFYEENKIVLMCRSFSTKSGSILGYFLPAAAGRTGNQLSGSRSLLTRYRGRGRLLCLGLHGLL